MSVFCPQAAPKRRSAPSPSNLVGVIALLALAACASDEGADGFDQSDSGFGRPIDYSKDASMDGGASALDATSPALSTVRVRFVQGIANLGPLTVCHDADGPSGPSPAAVLSEGMRPLRSDFGAQSEELLLPQLRVGALSLHRESTASALDAGSSLDAGTRDGGVPDPCSASTLEALIPLPLPVSWREPYELRSEAYDLALLPALADAPRVTLLGSGLALNSEGLDQRAAQARSNYLRDKPDDTAGADAAGARERARLEAAFGPRTLIQSSPVAESTQSFNVSLFHAIPNLTAAGSAADQESAAVRVCIKSGTLVLPALPQTPEPGTQTATGGVPFRVRVPLELPLGMALDPRVDHQVRVFVARDLDAAKSDCSASLKPVAERTFARDRFQAGRSYTLALLGAVSAADLCSASNKSFVRPGCARPSNQLTPRIEVFEDGN